MTDNSPKTIQKKKTQAKKEKKDTDIKKTLKDTGKAKTSKQMAKEALKAIGGIPVLTEEQQKQMLTAMALGLVKDRFGFEVSVQDKLKALKALNELSKQDGDAELIEKETNEASTFADALEKFKVDGVDY